MVSFIPAMVQKRLLRYALSHFPVVDTDTLDLEQLDIAWGKRSSVELRDVGLHVKKLANLMNLPDQLRPTKAQILSLRITVPADIYSSGILVEVRGIDIRVRLDSPRDGKYSSAKYRPQNARSKSDDTSQEKRARVRLESAAEDASEDHIPTAEELAASFLDEEPSADRQELKQAIQEAGLQVQEDSDEASETSDEDTGTGVGITVPAFLANFLKGVVDRVQMSISDVRIILESELQAHEDLPSNNPAVSVELGLASVDIEGLTTSTSPKDVGSSEDAAPTGRRVRIQGIHGDLVTEAAVFTALEHVATLSSQRSQQSPSETSHRSLPNLSLSRRSQRVGSALLHSQRASPAPFEGLGTSSQRSDLTDSQFMTSRDSVPAETNRIADSSDGGYTDDDDPMLTSQMHTSSLLASSRFTPSHIGDIEGELPFPIENAQSSDGDQSQEIDIFPALLIRSNAPSVSTGIRSLDEMAKSDPMSTLERARSHGSRQRQHMFTSQPLSTSEGGQPFDRDAAESHSDVAYAYSTASRSESLEDDEASREDLSQSMMFSHEQAESMYMSAMSEASGLRSHPTPGSWDGSSSTNGASSHSPSEMLDRKPIDSGDPAETGTRTPRPRRRSSASPSTEELSAAADTKSARANTVGERSESEVPPQQARLFDGSSPQRAGRSLKRLFAVDEISVYVPWASVSERDAGSAGEVHGPEPVISTAAIRHQMPGAFSQYRSTIIEKSMYGTKSTVGANLKATALPEDSLASLPAVSMLMQPQPNSAITVRIGRAECNVDLSALRLLHRLGSQVQEAWSKQALPNEPAMKPDNVNLMTSAVRCSLEHCTLAFFDVLAASVDKSGLASSSLKRDDALLRLDMSNAEITNAVHAGNSRIRAEVRTIDFGYLNESVICFAKPGRMPSTSKTKDVQNVDLVATYTESPLRGPEVEIHTLPVVVFLNLPKLDERLSTFGGISGILDMSNSVTSVSTILASSPVVQAKPQGVRFGDAPSAIEAPLLCPININVRFRGLKVVLEGRACAVMAESGTFAITIRKTVARVKTEKIKIHAPLDPGHPSDSAITLTAIGIDAKFLVSGNEDDFEAMVALIEPSGDRYDDDDGFLLDMLRRQRKNGSVLRFSVTDIQCDVDHLEHMDRLQQLVEELGRLSSGVSKYLPEDDRPGILILPRIQTLRAHAFINDNFGDLEAACNDIDIAYVGVPLIFGLKIGSINLNRQADVILDPLLDLAAHTSTPSVMARFIGNVPEPRMKIKLFNLLVEYKISTVLAVLGLSNTETLEDLAMSMAASVATVREDASSGTSDLSSSPKPANPVSQKLPMPVDVVMRDCAIGLNPAESKDPEAHVAKALFLLSQAQISVEDDLGAQFQLYLLLKRSSLLLINNLADLDPQAAPGPRPHGSENLSPAIDDLSRQGFRAVASVWSAEVHINVSQNESAETVLDVDLKNKLFTLETCADSTQTLITVLGGLAPPIPKKRQQMYRTHVKPIEDLMKSFTGEPFVQSDADEATDSQLLAESVDMDDADHITEDIPSNIEFMGNFYDPEDETGGLNPSVLGSVSRMSSRLLAPVEPDGPFGDIINERFEHGPKDTLIDPSEDYLELFRFKTPVRRWNSKTASLDPIYERQIAKCPINVKASLQQVTWNLYDGYDWATTRNAITKKVVEVEAKIEKRRKDRRSSARDDDDAESEIEDMLFQSIWIAVPPNADERDLRRGINRLIADPDEFSETASTTRTMSVDTRATGRPTHRRRKSRALHLERSRKKISFDLRQIVANFIVLPPGSEETENAAALRIGDFEIYDHVPSSTWKKFATYLHDAGERQMGKPMIRLDIVTVRPVADLAATEMIIKAHILPLRLHVDQDALDFITRFFEFKDDQTSKPTPRTSAPSGPYIARLEVNTIPVQLDYKPKKVDYAGLRSGSTSEFANFVILDRAEFHLKRLILYGVQSPDFLQPQLKSIWTADVINNQLPTVLGGLAGVRPFVEVGKGVRDLVMVPMREYKKDGRIVRSIQKGAMTFAKTTASELARLGAKFAIGTQNVLEGAEGMLSTTDRRRRSRQDEDWDYDEFSTSPARDEQRAVSNYAAQPLNVVTGLRDAWQGLERDLVTARDAIIAIGGDVRESGSAMGAAGAVARLAPTVILRPAIGASRAVGMTLMGAGNMLDKDSRRKIEDKYKRY